ncbi:hypothetical protein ACOMHN_003874 [Nucella lapillus]
MDTETSPPSHPPQLACHDSKLLDLAFAMDTTVSMLSYIKSACNNIRRIVEDIVAKESSDLRLALVEYRDHPPQESSYVTQVHDFTSSVGTMKGWLEQSTANGGGDTPEAVADALHDVLKLSWRPEATKICVLVSDAPPHGLQPSGDGFPNGCPAGHDPMDIVRKLAEKGITLYVAGCEPALTPCKDFFAALAHVTGGQYVPLAAAGALTAVIIGGAQEELSLEQWMGQVNQLVLQEVQQRGADNVDHDALSHHVMGKLGAAGMRSKQLRRNKASLEGATSEAIGMSKCTNMADMRSAWKPQEVLESSRGGAPMMCAPMMGAPMMGGPMTGASMASETDCYETGEGEIQMEQAQRMVQKSLMRNKILLAKK